MMNKTSLTYLTETYLKKLEVRVLAISVKDKTTSVILDKTIFYPQGGGQPGDQGIIKSANGSLKVTNVVYNNGQPLHQGKLTGNLAAGEEIECSLDWDRRYRNMKLHSAGHLVHEVIHETYPELVPTKAQHGIRGEKYIEYEGNANLDALKLNLRLQQLIADDLLINCYFVTLDELKTRAAFIPDNLPKNKPLRVAQIGDYSPVPDGGTQVKSTKELIGTTISNIETRDGLIKVNYELNTEDSQSETDKGLSSPKRGQSFQSAEKLATKGVSFCGWENEDISSLKNNAIALISDAENLEELEELRIKYLGRKGEINQLMAKLPKLADDEKKAFGQNVNEAKSVIEAALSNQAKKLGGKTSEKQWVDFTMPGENIEIGHLHLATQAIEEITRIFEKIGFKRVRYPTADWDWHAFEALNMPKNHPARDEWETFFVDAPVNKKYGQVVLTPHTSNGQVREMERVGKPPIRMLNIAPCFRRQTDTTHLQAFTQFEGLVVDKGISIAHLKGVIDYFAKEFYGEGVVSRLRPFHFQFTEPSFEVDFSCPNCKGTTKLTNGEKCRFCKSGWHEVGGAGMVHPTVLRNGGIDPEKYTGFAFGWGVERTYAMKPGVNISDVRLLNSTDMRILKQF